VHDRAGYYCVDTAHVLPKGQPLFFASVRIGTRYVSYHLMPVYLWPELLEGISDRLRRCLQGKSCFGFTRLEPDVLAELSALTRDGYDRYCAHEYIQRPRPPRPPRHGRAGAAAGGAQRVTSDDGGVAPGERRRGGGCVVSPGRHPVR
jgi:hypothetical protein